MSERKIKVLISKVGLDGHDRGAKVVASLLREAGMEVVYLGRFQTPQNIVQAALEEDVDVIGLSCLSGGHLAHTPTVVKLMRKEKMDDVLLIVGGIFPREDIKTLREMGVHEVFLSSMVTSIVDYVKKNVRSTPK